MARSRRLRHCKSEVGSLQAAAPDPAAARLEHDCQIPNTTSELRLPTSDFSELPHREGTRQLRPCHHTPPIRAACCRRACPPGRPPPRDGCSRRGGPWWCTDRRTCRPRHPVRRPTRAARARRPARSQAFSGGDPRPRSRRRSAAAWRDARADRSASRASNGRGSAEGSAARNDRSAPRSPSTTASTADSNRATGEPVSPTARTCSSSRSQSAKSYARATANLASSSPGGVLRISSSLNRSGSQGTSVSRKRGCLCRKMPRASASPAWKASSSETACASYSCNVARKGRGVSSTWSPRRPPQRALFQSAPQPLSHSAFGILHSPTFLTVSAGTGTCRCPACVCGIPAWRPAGRASGLRRRVPTRVRAMPAARPRLPIVRWRRAARRDGSPGLP